VVIVGVLEVQDFVYLKYALKRTFLSTFRECDKRNRTQGGKKIMTGDEIWSFIFVSETNAVSLQGSVNSSRDSKRRENPNQRVC